MAVTLTVLPAKRIAVAIYAGAVNNEQSLRFWTEFLKSAGQERFYDMIIDLREYAGSVDNESVQSVAAARAARQRKGKTRAVVFVSPDPNFELWLEYIRLLFADCECMLVSTMDEALDAVASWRADAPTGAGHARAAS